MLSKILRKSTAKTLQLGNHHDNVVVSESLSSWEIIDPTLTDDDDEDLFSVNEDDVTIQDSLVTKQEEVNEVELKGACVSEDEDDVDDDDENDGLEEDLMRWKMKGRFEKQKMGKRVGLNNNIKKMPCYYHVRPKTLHERRGKRLLL